jgi:hypothetical protein
MNGLHSSMRIRALCSALAFMSSIALSQAQERDRVHRASRPAHSHAAVHPLRTAAVSSTGTVRSLTIIRRPPPTISPDQDDIYVDGPIRYNSIRTFDPAPYADSGRQFPFGLDGIGGYGSDLGVDAGHDAAIYDRGF